MLFLTSAVLNFKINFFLQNSFKNTIRVSNSLDPDQDRPFVGPDLETSCLQRLLADNKSCCLQGMSSHIFSHTVFSIMIHHIVTRTTNKYEADNQFLTKTR